MESKKAEVRRQKGKGRRRQPAIGLPPVTCRELLAFRLFKAGFRECKPEALIYSILKALSGPLHVVLTG